MCNVFLALGVSTTDVDGSTFLVDRSVGLVAKVSLVDSSLDAIPLKAIAVEALMAVCDALQFIVQY